MDSEESNIETVAVVGALETQGTSVIRSLSSSSLTSHWRIRALTSSPDSDAARALSQQANISVIYCDVNDTGTIRKAFAGCTHIFANTAFHGGTLFAKGQAAAEKLEYDQGMNLVRAATETETLKHLVWSTLMDSSLISEGNWKVPHFMSKQGANAYIVGGYPGYEGEGYQAESNWGSLRERSTLMAIGMYASNLRNHAYRPVKKVDSDDYVIQLPCPADVPFSVAGDESKNVGAFVRAIFEQPEKSLGTWVNCESENISCRQWVEYLDASARSQGVKRKITFEESTMQDIEDKWGILGNEIGQMMAYIGEVKDRAFENTSGLPGLRASQLGIESELVSTKTFYDGLDCVALLKGVDNGERHLGTASR